MAATKEQKRAYYRRHRERLLAEYKESKRWRKYPRVGRDKRDANARYRAAKLQASPAWADQEAISFVYHCAAVIGKVYGNKPHVDHIVPLKGEEVCGLHVHNNLQLLSASDNSRKGNTHSIG